VSNTLSRRSLLMGSGLALTAGLLPEAIADSEIRQEEKLLKVDHNENAWGPSSLVRPAIVRELSRMHGMQMRMLRRVLQSR
jgi:hypothetical protein